MPFCLMTGAPVGGGDIRAALGTPYRVMVSHWFGSDRDTIIGWELDTDDNKIEPTRAFHPAALGLTWVKPAIVQPWRAPRDPKVDIDLTYKQMLDQIAHLQRENRRRDIEFEEQVEKRAREMFEGMLATDRPGARPIRI